MAYFKVGTKYITSYGMAEVTKLDGECAVFRIIEPNAESRSDGI